MKKTIGNTVPSKEVSVKPAGMPKGAPAKKAVKAPDNSPKTNPLAVNKAAGSKKAAKVPSPAITSPYGTSSHSK